MWWDIFPEELVAVDLPDDQRELIVRALIEWGGPTRPTDAIARAMGFAGREAIDREGDRAPSRFGHPEQDPLAEP